MKKKSKINFNKIGGIITDLMRIHSIDATELSLKTGVPTSTISRLRSPSDRSPNLSSLMPIADFFDITISQLIGEEEIDYNITNSEKDSILSSILSIPILNEDTIEGYINNKVVEFESISIDIPISENAFAYILSGNAMEPEFPDKTLLIIDPTIEPENLDFILLATKSKKKPIFRQILIEGGERYIKTSNPLFNEFNKLSNQYDKIIGVMVQSRRSFKNSDAPQNKNKYFELQPNKKEKAC